MKRRKSSSYRIVTWKGKHHGCSCSQAVSTASKSLLFLIVGEIIPIFSNRTGLQWAGRLYILFHFPSDCIWNHWLVRKLFLKNLKGKRIIRAVLSCPPAASIRSASAITERVSIKVLCSRGQGAEMAAPRKLCHELDGRTLCCAQWHISHNGGRGKARIKWWKRRGKDKTQKCAHLFSAEWKSFLSHLPSCSLLCKAVNKKSGLAAPFAWF